MTTYANSQQIDWLPTESDASTSSPEVSHVRIFHLRESRRVSRMEHDPASGLKSLDSLASYDPTSSLWKTSQTCLLAQASGQADGLAEFWETWPRSGMMRSGTAYQLPTLGPGIDGTEFGWLPTPTKSDGKGSPRGRFFGSPTYRSNLKEALRDGPADPVYPNPDFVEEMMGFPRLFSALNDSEIASFRKSRK